MKTKSKFPIRQTTVKIPPNPQPRCSRWTTLPDLKQNSRLRGGATAGPHSAWTWPNPWNLSLAGTLTATVPQLKIVRAFRRKNLFTPIFFHFFLFLFHSAYASWADKGRSGPWTILRMVFVWMSLCDRQRGGIESSGIFALYWKPRGGYCYTGLAHTKVLWFLILRKHFKMTTMQKEIKEKNNVIQTFVAIENFVRNPGFNSAEVDSYWNFLLKTLLEGKLVIKEQQYNHA